MTRFMVFYTFPARGWIGWNPWNPTNHGIAEPASFEDANAAFLIWLETQPRPFADTRGMHYIVCASSGERGI